MEESTYILLPQDKTGRLPLPQSIVCFITISHFQCLLMALQNFARLRSQSSFLLLLCSLLILPTASLRAQQPWQKLSFPTTDEIKATFKTPPAYYSHSVTWGWNGPMSRDAIGKDLDSLYRRGFRAVTIEAGYRMPADYLSEGWFGLVKTAVEEAKKRNMHIWIIDEGKYPSGFAGGKFSRERPDLRMQALVMVERIPVSGGQTISRNMASTVTSAVALNLTDSNNVIVPVKSGNLTWTAPPGNWQLLLVQPQFKTAVTRAANNPTGGKDTTNSLCDYLNPLAVKQFLDFTHEQYKKHLGDEFGKTILGFRGDEPDYAHTPWTPAMLTEFSKRKGYDVQPWLASFFLRNLTDEQKKVKADYWDVWSDLFGDNFFTQQANWCAKNNLEYMVHLNHDEAMIGLVKSEGDFYKAFRSVQIPGIDVIWHQVWPGLVTDFPKFASSAAHQFGRPRSLSESFAAMNPAPDVEQARWIVNQQLVRGINLFEFMFFGSTAEGKGGSRGYMADAKFPALMAYANRAGYLLSQGRPAAQIAVYFPTTSLWLGYNVSEKSAFTIAQELLESQHDFDFIDEYALTTASSTNGALVNKSGQEYKAIIVPSIKVLSQAAYNRLKAFAKAGGQVVFAEEKPSLITTKNFLTAESASDFSWASQSTASSYKRTYLPTDVKLDQPATALKYLHRKWKDAELYFFFNESAEPLSRNITLAGKGKIEEWDAQSGNIRSLPASGNGATTQISLSLQPYETKFIIINQ